MPRKGQPMSAATKEKLRRLAAERRKSGSSGDNLAAAPLAAAPLAEPEQEDTDFELDIQVPDVAPPPISLKDRLMKKFGGSGSSTGDKPSKRKPKAKPGGSKDLLFSFLPIIAGFIATYASSQWDEEYRECAPNKEEVAAILLPIFNIVARRIEITGKMSEDALDIFTCILAIVVYSTRAFMIYDDIKKGNRDANISDTRNDTSRREGEITLDRAYRHGSTASSIIEKRSELEGTNVSRRDDSIDDGQSETHETSVSALLAKARKRDFEYRTRNGLL